MATKIHRDALRQRIKELAGLTDDERAALLELVKTKKYGLVWEEHPEAVEERLRTHLPVLDEVKERYIPGSSPDSPNHIIIEGDNLEALTALSYTHEGRIDVIYIDPPYNTGNKDFKYNDSFVDSEDAYRHSKWLSFMSKRLRIAKRLLSDRGVIFISIDDNEQANLKLLCDEVFSEKNMVGHLIWESVTQPVNTGSARFMLQQKTESLLCYAKSNHHRNTFLLELDEESQLSYPHNGQYGNCRFEIIEKSDSGRYKRDTMKYPILGQYPREGKRWQIGKETARKLEKTGKIEIVDGIVKKAVYPEDEVDKVKYKPFWSLLKAEDVGSALNAKAELNETLGREAGFDTVKPTFLIMSLLKHFPKSSTVLDFFAGSGTTLHAVMQLNKEDGGHRQCILVTNNENNICEEVTYERNRRVINGYTTPKGEAVEGLHDNSLRYYRTRLLPRQRTNKNMHDLMEAATDLLCIKEDIYDEQPIHGLDIKNIRQFVRLFGREGRYMLVIYNQEAIRRIVPWLADSDLQPVGKIKVYTFSYDHYAYDDDFAEVEDRVQLCALPAAIYEAYRRVLPTEDRYYDNEPIDTPDTDGKEDNQ